MTAAAVVVGRLNGLCQVQCRLLFTWIEQCEYTSEDLGYILIQGKTLRCNFFVLICKNMRFFVVLMAAADLNNVPNGFDAAQNTIKLTLTGNLNGHD